MTLRELRVSNSLTQKAAAEICGIPLRTYVRYEQRNNAENNLKYQFLKQKLEQYSFVDEKHGILTRTAIISACEKVFEEYPIEYCYLFGSYAKGNAGEESDVDLLLSTEVNGLRFYGLVERLREAMKKNVDVLEVRQLPGNADLLNEILKYGEKIYEQKKR